MIGLSPGSADRRRTKPRLVGCTLHTLAVKAGKSCSGSPNLSSDSGCTWNWILALSRWIRAREYSELRRRHGQRAAAKERIIEPHTGAAERRAIHFIERLDA